MKAKAKKLIGMIMVMALFVTALPYTTSKVSKAADDYGLENPRVEFLTRDIVEFGHYWQEDTNSDGVADENDEKTPIRWQVLERNGDELFLLADKILDRKAYNDKHTDITWEDCTLRSWLNSDFYDTAFSSAEKAGIKESNITNSDNSYYGTEGGSDTKDQVFLMSIEEMTSYGFNEDIDYYDQARMGKVTAYAKEKGLSAGADGAGWWGLRSPGKYSNFAAVVDYNGYVYDNGDGVGNEDGVRPALRINLSSLSGYVKDAGKENVAVKAASWDTVTFGSYNGNALTWRVLNVSGDDAFLLSDKIITEKAYNDEWTDITWENCTLRTWLNGDFYNSAFSSDEKSMIKDTNVINEDNEYCGTAGGNNTTDKVYLLSLSEIIDPSYGFPDVYWCESDTRIAYAVGSTGAGGWWLRSPGYNTYCAAEVDEDGYVSGIGDYVDDVDGVRPALHINLSSSAWTKGEKVTAGSFVEQPTPTPTATPTATPTPTASPTSTPTATPTAKPTVTPTATPIVTPTSEPTKAPSTEAPSTEVPPTEEPTEAPKETETPEPTADVTTPTSAPTDIPVVNQTPVPAGNSVVTPTIPPVSGQPSNVSPVTKTIKLSGVKIKRSSKLIKGKISVKGATIKIKVGKKTYKKLIKGKSFSIRVKVVLKKKTKITINITKTGYIPLKKEFKVK